MKTIDPYIERRLRIRELSELMYKCPVNEVALFDKYFKEYEELLDQIEKGG